FCSGGGDLPPPSPFWAFGPEPDPFLSGAEPPCDPSFSPPFALPSLSPLSPPFPPLAPFSLDGRDPSALPLPALPLGPSSPPVSSSSPSLASPAPCPSPLPASPPFRARREASRSF